MERPKEYFAFISYQRKDEEWADRLRCKLEHYRLPSSVRKQDASLPKEIRPIFRSHGKGTGHWHHTIEEERYHNNKQKKRVICQKKICNQWQTATIYSSATSGTACWQRTVILVQIVWLRYPLVFLWSSFGYPMTHWHGFVVHSWTSQAPAPSAKKARMSCGDICV